MGEKKPIDFLCIIAGIYRHGFKIYQPIKEEDENEEEKEITRTGATRKGHLQRSKSDTQTRPHWYETDKAVRHGALLKKSENSDLFFSDFLL